MEDCGLCNAVDATGPESQNMLTGCTPGISPKFMLSELYLARGGIDKKT